MNIYIAASLSQKNNVRGLFDLFRADGHLIIRDWTAHEVPHSHKRDKKSNLVAQVAKEDVEGVKNTDVFIILSDGPVTAGRYVELGIAIHSHLEKGKPMIYAVGDNTMESIFYYHPSVKRKRTIEEVLKELKTTKT